MTKLKMLRTNHLSSFNYSEQNIKGILNSFIGIAIVFLLYSCDIKKEEHKSWVKTIDGHYSLWVVKDSLQYMWKGDSFDNYINGNGILTIYKGGVLLKTINFFDEKKTIYGALSEEDVENSGDDIYIGETKDNKYNGVGILKKKNGDIYCGQFLNGNPHGNLNYYTDDILCYKGEWQEGKWNGNGTHYFPDGEYKTGFWVNGNLSNIKDSKAILPDGEYFGKMESGIANGLGKMIYTDGSIFNGEWINGVINGNGCWIGTKKDTITGEFQNGLMHGYAESTSAYGEYYGSWQNGNKSGIGSFFYADGSVYDGSWEDNKKEGVGEIFISNGDSYDGYWSNNKRNNYGHYYFKNGDTYSGEWKDNYQNGYGTFESIALKYNGDWTDGKVAGSGDILYKKTGDQYKGNFKENLKSGIGAYYFKNGNKYEGEFKNDLFSGNGVFTFKDGNVYQGEFYNAKMYGYGTLYLKESKGIIAITANWDGTNKFPAEASILFPNGDLYEGPLANGFPTSKGHWTTEKERLNPKSLALNDKSLADRANSFYKTHRESINYVKDQTQNVLIVVDVASTVLIFVPFPPVQAVGGALKVVSVVGRVAYSAAVAAEVASKSKDAYDAHESGDDTKAKSIMTDAGKDVAFDAAILVAGSAIKAGGKIVKKLPLKAMSKPLLTEGKIFAKRFELSLSKNGTFQKIAVQSKGVLVMPKFVNTKASRIRLPILSIPFNKNRKLAYDEMIAKNKLLKERSSTKVFKRESKTANTYVKKINGNEIINESIEQGYKKILGVPYEDIYIIKNGKKILRKIPIFDGNISFRTKLPTKLYGSKDTEQFLHCVKSMKSRYLKNSDEVIKTLKSQNLKMLERDNILLEKNKEAILNAQKKMLQATKNNDLEGQKVWLKELRKQTNKITFIHTPKGKPFVLYTPEEILEKQLKDINNPRSSTQGRVFGYVWHHAKQKGKMELVAKDMHEFNKHTGGKAAWGGNR
jgi:hypothetical protein